MIDQIQDLLLRMKTSWDEAGQLNAQVDLDLRERKQFLNTISQTLGLSRQEVYQAVNSRNTFQLSGEILSVGVAFSDRAAAASSPMSHSTEHALIRITNALGFKDHKPDIAILANYGIIATTGKDGTITELRTILAEQSQPTRQNI